MKKKIFITRTFFESEIRSKLSQFDLIFWEHEKAPSKAEIIKYGQGAFALLTMLSDPIDDEVIRALAPDLKIISNYAVGVNNIDLESAKRCDVIVSNTPDVLTDAVAELVVGMMIALGRGFEGGSQVMRAGKFEGWEPGGFLGRQIAHARIGIIGMGRIGQEVARRLKAFKCELSYNSRSRKGDLEKELNLTFYELDRLVSDSDYLVLCLGLSEQAYHLIDKRRLGLMKQNAIIINIGRGALIDETELIEALKRGQIAGAALDVYEQEPYLPPELRELDNVLLLPHIGSATTKTRMDMLELALQNIVQVGEGASAVTPV